MLNYSDLVTKIMREKNCTRAEARLLASKIQPQQTGAELRAGKPGGEKFSALVSEAMATLALSRAEATAFCVSHHPDVYRDSLVGAGVVAGKRADMDAVEHHQSFRSLGLRLLCADESARRYVRDGKLAAVDELRGLYRTEDLDRIRLQNFRKLAPAVIQFTPDEKMAMGKLYESFEKFAASWSDRSHMTALRPGERILFGRIVRDR